MAATAFATTAAVIVTLWVGMRQLQLMRQERWDRAVVAAARLTHSLMRYANRLRDEVAGLDFRDDDEGSIFSAGRMVEPSKKWPATRVATHRSTVTASTSSIAASL